MIYCISDIHGEIDRFHAMLDKIWFTSSDTLYVLGDVIDRKESGVAILQEIMKMPNCKMLLGNHEYMCLNAMLNREEGATRLWKANGSSPTYRALKYKLSDEERESVLRFLLSLPDHADIAVGGKAYHLVHGWFGSDTYSRVWTRPTDFNREDPFGNNFTMVVGHTPTPFLRPRDYSMLSDADEFPPFSIFHATKWGGREFDFYDIDCGCGNETPLRRLGCLRLDDLQEFYV